MLPLLCLLAGLAATVTGACVAPFTVVGEGCYYFSLEDNIILTWDEARQYCLSLGSEVDLAMLDYVCDDFRNLGSYLQVQAIIEGIFYATFIGATGAGDSWYWVDGRSFSIESSYWASGSPFLEISSGVSMSRVMDGGRSRIYVEEFSTTFHQPFICQDFSVAAAVQQ